MTDDMSIAIIGMAGRFPGARNVEAFWRNLCAGVESIHFLSENELASLGISPAALNDPRLVKARAMLDDPEWFDAAFFGFSPKEAELMDPQHRVLLECAWEALEDAGYDPETYPGAIGVYAGATISTYLLLNLLANPDLAQSTSQLQVHLGNAGDFLTTRLSYKLNLKGPSFMLESACSTSLVAVHVACQSLLNEECDLALAGGVSINIKQRAGYYPVEGGMESLDGHCRAFDARAQGTIFGSGAGLVVLKRLEEALADNDCIQAVIRGSALNNDGALKVGYTAPGVEGQAQVIAEALANAGVSADTITYVETHGTGTSLGDPIEIQALTKAYRSDTDCKGYCAIGSVKTNVGHLEAAAGIASLIKASLALKHKQIPPSLHFERPNPEIDFAGSPFYVNTKLAEWEAAGKPRRAGVSSFGFGGTNAHVILEEPPPLRSTTPARPYQLLLLSAKTEAALEKATTNLVEYLRQQPELNLADAAYTLQVGRRSFNHRRAAVCRDNTEASAALETLDAQCVFTGALATGKQSLVFLFPGQGTQYVNMAAGLYRSEPFFRQQVDLCAEKLRPHLGLDLRTVLFPTPARTTEATQQLNQTALVQPALFVVEYALAQLWLAWGIQPQAMIGHSIGEYVAACLAGVFSLEDALLLVAARGRLMQQMPPGAMLATPLPEREMAGRLGPALSIAAVNDPASCVVAGPVADIEALESQLRAEGVLGRRLHTSHAFHSALMEPILDAFTTQAAKVQRNAPDLPYLSNLTGDWITAEQATDPAYWAQHLRRTVRFSDGLATLLREPGRIFLEVGPGHTLSQLVKRQPAYEPGQLVLNSVHHPQENLDDEAVLLAALGKLWLAGINIDWPKFYGAERRHRVPLPTYPFERRRYWIDAQALPLAAAETASAALAIPDAVSRRSNIADYFFTPVWEHSPQKTWENRWRETSQVWLIFVDSGGVGEALAQQLQAAGQDVVQVTMDEQFQKTGDLHYSLNPERPDHYRALFAELQPAGKLPDRMIHLWSLTASPTELTSSEQFERAQYTGFYSLLFLAQALTNQDRPVQIDVITNQLHDLTGNESIAPEKATLLGACRVLPQEYPALTCRCIDGVLTSTHLVAQLLAELQVPATADLVAYRGAQRWTQSYKPLRLENAAAAPWRDQGVYLIVNGLKGIGYVLAEHLAQAAHAKLILIESAEFPPREAWAHWLTAHTEQDETSRKIKRAQALESLAEVFVPGGDITKPEQWAAMLAAGESHFGALHGVLYAADAPHDQYFQPVQSADPAACQWHFAPKAHGGLALAQALGERRLDFCLFNSSLAAILGGLGYVTYSAASAFSNALAQHANQTSATPWISVDWDAWQLGKEAPILALNAELAQLALTPAEGKEAFSRILGSGLTQVIVSTTDLIVRLNQSRKRETPVATSTPASEPARPLHPRPKLLNPYVAPASKLEKQIAEIWQKSLGFEQIGVTDNFFDLGGDSFTAMHVIARLKNELSLDIPVVRLYEGLTVRSLSQIVAEPESDESAAENDQPDLRADRRRQYQQNQRSRRKHTDAPFSALAEEED